jgi:hypothetical protein
MALGHYLNRWTLALLLTLVLAAALRLHGIDFGFPALLDADELIFELGGTRLLIEQTLNPGWFGHPATTTMYMLAVVNASTFGAGWLAGEWSGPAEFITRIWHNPGIVLLPGRIAIAAFGVLSVWLVWRIGRQMSQQAGGPMIALVAALLLACSPVHVHYSQIIRSDVMGTAFMLLCLSAALRIADQGRSSDFRWAAFWLAMAVASKWPFAIVGLAVVGAVGHRMLMPGADRRVVWRQLATFLLLFPVFLLMISPYLLLDYQTVLANLIGEGRVQHLSATSGGFVDNLLWYIRGGLRDGLGVAALILAGAGLVLMSRYRALALIFWPVVIAQILILCLHGLRWERWVVPLLPLLALAAGLAAAELARWISECATSAKAERPHPWLLPALVTAILVIPAVLIPPAWSGASARVNDTRLAASRWAMQHIPPGKRLLIEHFAFDLMGQQWTVLFPMGTAGCVDAKAMVSGRMDYRTVDGARSGRSTLDYGTLPPDKRPSCRADYAIMVAMDRYSQDRHLFPAEYASYQSLLETMTIVATFRPEPGVRAGPVVYVMQAKDGMSTAVR